MRLISTCLLLACVPCLLSAQETRGSIFGTVTDPQGALISGATVVVANTGTGTSAYVDVEFRRLL